MDSFFRFCIKYLATIGTNTYCGEANKGDFRMLDARKICPIMRFYIVEEINKNTSN